jgi:hypothetical protein
MDIDQQQCNDYDTYESDPFHRMKLIVSCIFEFDGPMDEIDHT